MKAYHTEDVTLEPLSGKMMGVLGYGIQGSAQALNLRDAGFDVIVGGRPGKSFEAAKKEGFPTYSYAEAAQKADFVFLLVPDAAHAEVFAQIKVEGKTLVLAHGSSIHFGWIQPNKDCDVILVAPSGPGRQVRESFLSNKGMIAAFAVHQNASGQARERALALCAALRFTQAGVFECTFKDEAVCDLFGEQSVLCGGAAELVRKAYETLVEKGYPKEMAYFGTLYELGGITALYAAEGLDGMLERVSEAARFGGLKTGDRIIDEKVKENMNRVLEEIESGKFMNCFLKENESGYAETKKMMEKEKKKDINETGRQIRARFNL